jgi:hypothetical protein
LMCVREELAWWSFRVRAGLFALVFAFAFMRYPDYELKWLDETGVEIKTYTYVRICLSPHAPTYVQVLVS